MRNPAQSQLYPLTQTPVLGIARDLGGLGVAIEGSSELGQGPVGTRGWGDLERQCVLPGTSLDAVLGDFGWNSRTACVEVLKRHVDVALGDVV